MNLPFTTDQFLFVFERYNQAVWPFQIFANLLALVAVILAVKPRANGDKIIVAILVFLWLWIGIVYHFVYFTPINPAAWIFGTLTIIQAALFAYHGISASRLSFQYRSNGHGMIGAILILYALIVYPLLGYVFGHVYPQSPTFGLPCPTTILTFGLLLWTSSRIPKATLVIPLLWSCIGFSAALTMGIHEDIGLLVAGIAATTVIVIRDRRPPDLSRVRHRGIS